jgi:integrase/recombinase XerD
VVGRGRKSQPGRCGIEAGDRQGRERIAALDPPAPGRRDSRSQAVKDNLGSGAFPRNDDGVRRQERQRHSISGDSGIVGVLSTEGGPMPKQNHGIRKSVKGRLHMAAPHVGEFKIWLREGGYRETTIEELVRLLACWTDWADGAGFTIDTVSAAFGASGAAAGESRNKREILNSAALFIRYLQDLGVVPRSQTSMPTRKAWPILGEFRTWMRSHRGITASSLDTYQTTLVDLFDALGDDAQAYTPHAIRAFVLERARPHGLARAKSIAVATRTFLRFLVATGRCPPGREYAVPGFASWRLASVPGFLAAEEIDRVIAACAGERRLRDRAVVLLLARLGLRASEVANLDLHHIDWRNGRLAVSGKSRRAEWLPLTQEIGDVILAYIERGRPRVAPPRLFLTNLVPLRPITRAVVKHIVRRALIRAGVNSVHQGAHILRHSAATQMLRHGVSLAGVGAVLRHRDLTMTMHYAKVDFALLSEIAQPWAGSAAC